MNGQTICQYGNISLYRCTIHTIQQRPALESSGTDLKCWKFNVTVTGYLQSSDLATLGSYYGPIQGVTPSRTLNGSAAASYAQVRWQLVPRQRFWLATGCSGTDITTGKTVLFADPFSAQIANPRSLLSARTAASGDPENGQTGMSLLDCNDGPRCLQFDVVHVAADNVFRVQATFEIHRMQCADADTAGGNTTGILSHRWSVSDSLDHNLQATRSYNGMLEIASAQFSPHWFRSVVVPPLQGGFRRERMDFLATEDGKKLVYNIVDREVAVSAPPPARKWHVEYSEHLTNQTGFTSAGSISVMLEGDSEVDKMQLIMLGIWVISAKLLGIKPGDAKQPLATLNDMTITEYIGDVNAVMLTATCTRILESTENQVTPYMDGFAHDLALDDLPTWVKQYDPTRSMGAYEVGSQLYQVVTGVDGSGNPTYGDGPAELVAYEGPAALTGIFRSYLQSACSSTFGISSAGQGNLSSVDYNGTPDSSQTGPTVTASVTTTIDDKDDAEQPNVDYLSASMQANIYTHYQCEAKFHKKKMRIGVPIAAPIVSGIDTTDATAVVTIAKPQCCMTLTMHAERIGDWPEFPDGDSIYSTSPGAAPQYATIAGSIAQIGMTCVSEKLLGGTEQKTANGQSKFRAVYEAKFVLNREPTPTEILKFGHNPWSTDNGGVGTTSTTTLTDSNWS